MTAQSIWNIIDVRHKNVNNQASDLLGEFAKDTSAVST